MSPSICQESTALPWHQGRPGSFSVQPQSCSWTSPEWPHPCWAGTLPPNKPGLLAGKGPWGSRPTLDPRSPRTEKGPLPEAPSISLSVNLLGGLVSSEACSPVCPASQPPLPGSEGFLCALC